MNSAAVSPLKPWEVSNLFRQDSLISANSNSLIPPPSLPQYHPQDSYAQQNGGTSSSWFNGPTNTNNTSSFYSGNSYGSGRFGYSSGIGPYSSYGGTNFNSTPFNGPPAPGNYLTSSFENTTRPLFDSLNHVLQAVNHVACFVDSTIFAVWTSFAAVGSIITAFRNIKNIYIKRALASVRKYLDLMKRSLKTSTGRRKALILFSLFASIPILIKALQATLKADSKSDIILGSSESEEVELTRIDDSDSMKELISKTSFVRAIYPHSPADINTFLPFNSGDLIMISNEDLPKIVNDPPIWILGRLKDGRSGFFSSNYVNKIN